MNRKCLLTGLIVIFGLGIGLLLFSRTSRNHPVTILGTTVPPVPVLNPDTIAQGAAIYDQFCAECHGVDLKGAENWKIPQADGSYLPPPQDSSGHTWHHPDPVLMDLILNGGDQDLYPSQMPGFGGRLDETEAAAVLDYIKSTWGREEREYQWWLTAREQN